MPVDLNDQRFSSFGKLLEVQARLQKLLDRQLEDAVGLPLTWFEVLLRIARSDDQVLTMSALAGQVVLTSGGVTRLIDRMTEEGLVERVPCPGDRRVNWIKLTARGQKTLEDAAAVHLEHLDEEFAGRLNASEMAGLVRALDSLHASLS
ncbi:MAG: MarR family transcriptional regulator [Acidimicrobiia bacterium]|nr:MarR family transcriptional regulator [Acidimicrobiia bacterium]NNL28615.1 MarR family transcriptional regulator [Acidimicrobiia bacterium]